MTEKPRTETVSEHALRTRLDGLFSVLVGDAFEDSLHPARRYVSVLRANQEPRSTNLDDPDWTAAITNSVLDTATWARFTPDSLWPMLGGDAVRSQLQPRLADRGQYFDALAEIRLWGQIYAASGLSARFAVADGEPDLHLTESEEPLWIEVKRVRPASADRALSDAIYRANQQIKRATNGSGSGVAHVSVAEPQSWAQEESLVPPLEAMLRERILHNRNRSIAHVVLSWDDYVVVHGSNGTVAVVPRRRARSVYHNAPRVAARIPDEYLTLSTVSPWIYTPSPYYEKSFPALRLIKNKSIDPLLTIVGVEWQSVTEAMPEASWESYGIASANVGLAVIRSRVGFRPNAHILVGGLVRKEQFEVFFAYPIGSDVVKASPLVL